MKDRLEELRAQKHLLQTHLDWLEAEIAREEIHRGDQEPGETPAPAATDPHPAALSLVSPTDPTVMPEVDHKALKHEVRRGCLIYLTIFLAAILVLGLLGYSLYRP